jgi:hypothetical protein
VTYNRNKNSKVEKGFFGSKAQYMIQNQKTARSRRSTNLPTYLITTKVAKEEVN